MLEIFTILKRGLHCAQNLNTADDDGAHFIQTPVKWKTLSLNSREDETNISADLGESSARGKWKSASQKSEPGVLPVLSVPVMNLNRYCANLKISRLHLLLQLIFAPWAEGGRGGWVGGLEKVRILMSGFIKKNRKRRNPVMPFLSKGEKPCRC